MLVVLLFYYWTAATSAGFPPLPFGRHSYSDYYNLLLHGILKGHLYLDVPVDPVMLSSPNPYDPHVWVPHGWMMDSSFYHGRYYIYYGVVPALVFMLPFRLLTGGDLWLGTACEVSTVLAFLALVWLWLRIRRDYFPRAGGTIIFASVLALGLATGLLSLARRPLMYEFAIGTGCFFATLMLHSLYSVLSSERKATWMAAAGIFLGLAIGCRPTFLFVILAPSLVLFDLLRHGRFRLSSLSLMRAALGPAIGFVAGFGAILSGILLYNYLRFSSVFDFGYNYLLQDPICDLKHIWSLSYFGFNLRIYYIGTLEWTRYFPFATMGILPKWPQNYYGVADIFGILKYDPIVWFSLVAPVALWNKSVAAPKHIGVALGMIGLAYFGPGICELCFGNAALRYMVDFLPCLVLVAALGVCVFDQALSSPWAKRTVRGFWFVAAIFSAGVAVIISIPLEGTMGVQRGNAYVERIARVLNVPTSMYEQIRGWRFGPLTWKMTFPNRPPETKETLVQTPNAELLVEYLPSDLVRFGLRCTGDEGVLWGEKAKRNQGQVYTLSTSFGSLYPTFEHPYYLRHHSTPISQSSVYVGLDGRTVLQGLRPLGPVNSRDIQFADGRARAGWFSGDVLSVVRDEIPTQELTPDFSPRTFRVKMRNDATRGRWPLVSTGSSNAGDLLFLDVGVGESARFGYFSTGSPLIYGPPFPLNPGSPLEYTLQMETLGPTGGFRGPRRPLRIEMDGQTNWTSYVPYHPNSAGDVNIGVNTVSAPSIERAFPGGIELIATDPRLKPSKPTDHLMLRVIFPAQTRWGLSEPLLYTGVTGGYDGIGIVHYGGERGRFFLNHYGKLNQEGPIIDSLSGDSLHDIEVDTPVFSLKTRSGAPSQGTVVVRMDGKEVLRLVSDLFPAQLGEARVGGNDLSGATEKEFLGAILLERWIGVPVR